MDAKDIRNIQEAYMGVYSNQEEVEIDEAVKGADPEMRKVASSERRGGDKRLPPSKGKGYAAHAMQQAAYMDKKTKGKHIPGYAFPEEVDVYDIILSHLLDEGYAETVEAAEVIMVNMSEEWRQDIMEISQKLATKAYAERRTGEFEGDDSPERIAKTDKLEKRIKKKFGPEAAEHADRAADAKTFGRKDKSGRRKQTPQPRIQKSDYRTTQDGKMHKQDQRELKTDLRIKRDRRLRAARAADTED